LVVIDRDTQLRGFLRDLRLGDLAYGPVRGPRG